MPFNKIHVPESVSPEMCREINRQLHESLVETCGVHPEDDFTLVIRHPPEAMLFHPTFLGPREPNATIVFEIILRGGRTDTQKEALYAVMRRRLGEIGIDPRDSIIFLMENNAIDWSFGPEGSVKSVLGL